MNQSMRWAWVGAAEGAGRAGGGTRHPCQHLGGGFAQLNPIGFTVSRGVAESRSEPGIAVRTPAGDDAGWTAFSGYNELTRGPWANDRVAGVASGPRESKQNPCLSASPPGARLGTRGQFPVSPKAGNWPHFCFVSTCALQRGANPLPSGPVGAVREIPPPNFRMRGRSLLRPRCLGLPYGRPDKAYACKVLPYCTGVRFKTITKPWARDSRCQFLIFHNQKLPLPDGQRCNAKPSINSHEQSIMGDLANAPQFVAKEAGE